MAMVERKQTNLREYGNRLTDTDNPIYSFGNGFWYLGRCSGYARREQASTDKQHLECFERPCVNDLDNTRPDKLIYVAKC